MFDVAVGKVAVTVVSVVVAAALEPVPFGRGSISIRKLKQKGLFFNYFWLKIFNGQNRRVKILYNNYYETGIFQSHHLKTVITQEHDTATEHNDELYIAQCTRDA